MQIHIFRTGGVTAVRCSGRLVLGAGATEFRRAVTRALAGSQVVALDLAGVRQMDAHGSACLRFSTARRVVLQAERESRSGREVRIGRLAECRIWVKARAASDMPRAHEEVGHFVSAHRPDVVVYDVGIPYESSWDLLEAIPMAPALQ